MRIAPYTGPQRTLHTHLSADECLRRLHNDVADPNNVDPAAWQSLREEPAIERTIKEQTFMLRSEYAAKPSRNAAITWRMHGSIEQRPQHTLIHLHYCIYNNFADAWWRCDYCASKLDNATK